MARRLLRRVVPALAAGLALERREHRPRRAAVAALEDPDLLGTREQAPVSGGERRHLRQLGAVLAVAEALARVLPRLAEVRAPPDRRPVPFARAGGEDR